MSGLAYSSTSGPGVSQAEIDAIDARLEEQELMAGERDTDGGVVPVWYALADVIASAIDRLLVTVTAPLLAIGNSYNIACRLVRVGL